jgi:drug/metabolite transporter (DMT)-like permease
VALVELLRGLANLWGLGMVLGVAATLAWFVYSVFLKRLLRVRRIANIRLRRMLEERKRFEN